MKGLHAEMRQDRKDNVCYHWEPSEVWFWGKDPPAEREAAAAGLCTRGRQEERPYLFLLLFLATWIIPFCMFEPTNSIAKSDKRTVGQVTPGKQWKG